MNKLVYFILMACIVGACSDSDVEGVDEGAKDTDFYEIRSIPDKEVVYKAYSSSRAQIIGAGYDVTAGYLNFDAIKAPVIDLSKVPDEDFNRMLVNSSQPVEYVGKDARIFLSSMAYFAEVDDTPEQEERTAPLFAGTLLDHEEFSSVYNHSSQYSFAYCESVFSKERWWIGPLNVLKYRILSQQFLDDVVNITPDELIKKYGTHVLTDICLGRRLRGIYRTSVPTAASDQEAERITLISALWKLGQEDLLTGSAVGGVDDEVARSIGGQLVMEFHGGETSLLSTRPTKDELVAWQRSLTKENWALTEILHQATPIYELIEDAVKRKQVEEAVKQYIVGREIKVIQTAPLLQAWDGTNHTYYISYNDCIKDSHNQYEGPVCSLYKQGGEQRVPLYMYSNGKNHYFTVRSSGDGLGSEWQFQGIIGYVYTDAVEGAIPLYEVKSENDYCYTTENKESYGVKGNWKKERIVCYVLPL